MDKGTWKEIDNSLNEEKDEDNFDFLSNKANDFKIKFAKSLDANKLVRITKDGYQISWGFERALKTTASITPEDSAALNSLSDDDKKKVAKGAVSSDECTVDV